MGKIIINADDFGLTQGINRGIIAAFKSGMISSTSLIANGQAFEDALKLIKENPGLDIGIHLTIIEEKPLLPYWEVNSLLDRNGCFIKDYFGFAIKLLLGQIVMDQVEKEFDAQFRKIINQGLRITHIDSHQHIHMMPKVLGIIIKLAKKYGINKIRCPLRFGPLFPAKNFKHFGARLVLNLTCIFYQSVLLKNGLLSPKYSYSISSYNIKKMKEKFKNLITAQHPFIIEIICHPAEIDDDLLSRYRHWGYHWETELENLISKDLKKIFTNSLNQLINFGEI